MSLNQLDTADLLATVRKRKWLGIIPLIIIPLASLVISNYIPPVFESSIIISMGNQVRLSRDLQRLTGDFTDITGIDRDRRGELQGLKNEIASTPYLVQVVAVLDQDGDPELDEAARHLQLFQPEASLEELKQGILVERLKEQIGLEFVGRNLICISVQSATGKLARDLVEKLGEVLIAERRKRELGAVLQSSSFSFDQLEGYESELQKRIDRKTELEREYLRIQLVESVASEQNRKEIIGEIESSNLQIEAAKNEERELLINLSDIPSYVLDLHESSDLIDFRKQIEENCEALQNLLQQHAWNTPVILNLKVKLYDLEEKIIKENGRLVQDHIATDSIKSREQLLRLFNIRARLDILYLLVNHLELSLNSIENRINLIPEYQARIGQIEREITAAGALRDRFRMEQEGLQLSQALLNESTYRVIEPAQIPFEPIWPDKRKLGAIGLVLGLILGSAAIVFAELLDKSFRKEEEVEDFLGRPVAGIIPNIKGLKKLKYG